MEWIEYLSIKSTKRLNKGSDLKFQKRRRDQICLGQIGRVEEDAFAIGRFAEILLPLKNEFVDSASPFFAGIPINCKTLLDFNGQSARMDFL